MRTKETYEAMQEFLLEKIKQGDEDIVNEHGYVLEEFIQWLDKKYGDTII